MSSCSKCHTDIVAGEAYPFGDDVLCEDCYLDRMAQPKVCDPWAVYSAKRTSDRYGQLTPVQQAILDLLQAEGPLPAATVCARLQLSDDEFRTQFAALRHMEKARGCKIGDTVCYTLFDAVMQGERR